MSMQTWKILLVIVALAAVALVVPHTGSFVILLSTRALAFAILVMSLDILLGFTGLASLGQAAYLGVGAYLTAILATKYQFGLGYDFWASDATQAYQLLTPDVESVTRSIVSFPEMP